MASVSCIALVAVLVNFASAAAKETSSVGATTNSSMINFSNESSCVLNDNETDFLLEVYFNRDCLITLNTKVPCPLKAANSFVREFSGDLRIEGLLLNVWMVLAGASLMQAGGIPIPLGRAGTGCWALWMSVVLFQWLTVQLSLWLLFAAYLATAKQMGPCMVPWKAAGGTPFLHAAVLPYFVFQPRVFFLLYSGTLYSWMTFFGLWLLGTARDHDFLRKAAQIIFLLILSISLLFALFFLSWVFTAAVVFGAAFFLPMACCTAAGVCVSIILIRTLRKFVVQPVWETALGLLPQSMQVSPHVKDTSRMLWWMQVEEYATFRDKNIPKQQIAIMQAFQVFNICMLSIAAFSPAVCYGGLLAWYIYGRHTTDDNMRMVRTLYRHHFQIFWDWEFEVWGLAEIWESMFDCSIDCYAECILEALKFAAGLGNLLDVEPAHFLAGSIAIMSLNYILTLAKPMVPLLNGALLFCLRKEKQGEDRNMSIFAICAGVGGNNLVEMKQYASEMAHKIGAPDRE